MKSTKITPLMGGTYRVEGDYLLPNLIPPDTGSRAIGKYGRMHLNYLKEYHRTLYTSFVLNGTLWEHLSEIDQSCNERLTRIIPVMAKKKNVTEALKAVDQMEWGKRAPVALKLRTDRADRRDRRINSIRNRAEEIILTELVYA